MTDPLIDHTSDPTSAAHRRNFWLMVSGVVAVTLGIFGMSKGVFADPQTRTFAIAVFVIAWLAVTVLVRYLVRSGHYLRMLPRKPQ